MIKLGNNKWMFPSKPGGGGLPQPYDPKNGEYVNMSNSEILEQEMIRVDRLVKYNAYWIGYEPHFPTFGFHSDEYNKLWVKAYSKYFAGEDIPIQKANYLLTWRSDGDKSEFLIKIGYSQTNLKELKNDLYKMARFSEAIYDYIDEWGLRIYVPAKIKEHNIVECWIFNKKENNKLKFVTLDIKEEKYEKLFGTRK